MYPKVVTSALQSIRDFKDKAKPWHVRLVKGALAVTLTLVAALVLYWALTRRSRELARLRTERDRLVELDKQRQVDLLVEESQRQVYEALEGVSESQEALADLDERLEAVQAQRDKERAVIGAFTSWDDVDQYLDGGQ